MDNMMMGEPGEGGPQALGQMAQAAPAEAAPATLESFAQGLGAKYEKLMEAGEMLARVRESMDTLVGLQDVVSSEDVIEEAGKLVAAGLEASPVAALLAEIPDNSEALQAWVQTQNANVEEREAQLQEVLREIRHQMGVVGLKMILKGEAQGSTPGMM